MAKKKTNKTLLAAAALLGGWLLFSSFKKDNKKKGGNGDEDVYEYMPVTDAVLDAWGDDAATSGRAGILGNSVYLKPAFYTTTDKYTEYHLLVKYQLPKVMIDNGGGLTVEICTCGVPEMRKSGNTVLYDLDTAARIQTNSTTPNILNSIIRTLRYEVIDDNTLSVYFTLSRAEWLTVRAQCYTDNKAFTAAAKAGVLDTEHVKVLSMAMCKAVNIVKKDADLKARELEFYGDTSESLFVGCQIDIDTFFAQRFDEANAFGNDVNQGLDISNFALYYKHQMLPFVIDAAPVERKYKSLIGNIDNPYYSPNAYLMPHFWKFPIYRFGFVASMFSNNETILVKGANILYLAYNGKTLIDYSDDAALNASRLIPDFIPNFRRGDSEWFYTTKIRRKKGKLFSYRVSPLPNDLLKGDKTAWDWWINPNSPDAFMEYADRRVNLDYDNRPLSRWYECMFATEYKNLSNPLPEKSIIPLIREKKTTYLYDTSCRMMKTDFVLRPGEQVKVPFVLGFPFENRVVKFKEEIWPLRNILQGYAPVYDGKTDYLTKCEDMKSDLNSHFECVLEFDVRTGENFQQEEKIIVAFGAGDNANGLMQSGFEYNKLNYRIPFNNLTQKHNLMAVPYISPETSMNCMTSFIEEWKNNRHVDL